MCNNQTKARETYLHLKEWIETLRSGTKFELQLVSESSNNESINKYPLPSVIGTTNSMKLGKRYKSGIELNASRLSKHLHNNNETSLRNDAIGNEDEKHLSHTKRRTKKNSCKLCQQHGCAQWNCNKLKAYNGTILPKNSHSSRVKLGNKLLIPTNGIIEKREATDTRPLLTSFPKLVKAMVIHRKILLNENVIDTISIDNVGIEVTLLGNYGDVMNLYDKVLYSPTLVFQWVTRTNNTLVTHLL